VLEILGCPPLSLVAVLEIVFGYVSLEEEGFSSHLHLSLKTVVIYLVHQIELEILDYLTELFYSDRLLPYL
jgi:hypothetical protein